MKKKNVDTVFDIAELIQLFRNDRNEPNILQAVVTLLAKHMQADVCSIYMYDDRKQELILRATQGLNPDAVGKVKLKLGEGITGQVLSELKPICEGFASQNPFYKFFPGIGEEQYKAFLAVPILRGLRRVGSLVVQAREADFFNENDVKALRAIAAQLAPVIENVQLFEEVRGKTEMEEPALIKKPVEGKEKLLRGRPASTGIAQGRVTILNSGHYDGCPLPAPDEEPHTLEDFYSALKETERQINELQRQTGEELADVAVLIFSAHLLILQDKEFSGKIAGKIKAGMPAVKAIYSVVDEYVEIFSSSSMPQIREKVLDVKDLGNRLVNNLLNQEEGRSDYKGRIIVVHELLPSDIIKLAAENVEGFIVSSGVTSHNAIICRSLQIPMVAVSRETADCLPEGTDLLMDAEQGIIYVGPDEKVIQKYKELEKAWSTMHRASDMTAETTTKDGVRIHIYANVNLLSELKTVKKFKAEGVGLYRSEFPFIVRNDFPQEEEQYLIYRKLVDQMEGREVTFRTLDIGGDKMLSYYSKVNEANPFLGMRAIRFSLQNKDIFSTQLRAFLRAGAHGNTRIMFPLIASVDDFIEARNIVYECMDELEKKGIAFNRETRLGVMMELPSAIEVAKELAKEADFFSIGSNDLIQYMLAVDRTNEEVSKLYQVYHPAILRAINRIVRAAEKYGKDVSICGELATNEKMIPFLLGIGLTKFSINIRYAPSVQKLIKSIDIQTARETAETMLGFGRICEVEAYLRKHSPGYCMS